MASIKTSRGTAGTSMLTMIVPMVGLSLIVGIIGALLIEGSLATTITRSELTILKAPQIDQLRDRVSEHRGTDHAGDDDRAWEKLGRCITRLTIYDCQSSTRGNPPGWIYICPVDKTHSLCAIGFAGYGYSKLTARFMDCSRAYTLVLICFLTRLKGETP